MLLFMRSGQILTRTDLLFGITVNLFCYAVHIIQVPSATSVFPHDDGSIHSACIECPCLYFTPAEAVTWSKRVNVCVCVCVSLCLYLCMWCVLVCVCVCVMSVRKQCLSSERDLMFHCLVGTQCSLLGRFTADLLQQVSSSNCKTHVPTTFLYHGWHPIHVCICLLFLNCHTYYVLNSEPIDTDSILWKLLWLLASVSVSSIK